MRKPPRWQTQRRTRKSTINFYYLYYTSQALFHHGGKAWEKWDGAKQKTLRRAPRDGGDEDGSWDPIGEWGIAGGRVYSTALAVLTLQTFTRSASLISK